MIELPEAVRFARQLAGELKGKQVASALQGQTPHKFAFATRTPEEYQEILEGKLVGDAWPYGGCIRVALEPGYVVQLGGGGERILFHQDESTLPRKHQLLLGFTDGTYLSVTVQGWGSVQLYTREEVDRGAPVPEDRNPLSKGFTYDRFQALFGQLAEGDPASVKLFTITRPGIWGIGNGYTQDILFQARLHPRRRAISLTDAERRAFYDALCGVVRQATDLGGRDTELDLYGQGGGYQTVLDRRAKDEPCPRCGTPIEVEPFLGGRCYYCPECQPRPVA